MDTVLSTLHALVDQVTVWYNYSLPLEHSVWSYAMILTLAMWVNLANGYKWAHVSRGAKHVCTVWFSLWRTCSNQGKSMPGAAAPSIWTPAWDTQSRNDPNLESRIKTSLSWQRGEVGSMPGARPKGACKPWQHFALYPEGIGDL